MPFIRRHLLWFFGLFWMSWVRYVFGHEPLVLVGLFSPHLYSCFMMLVGFGVFLRDLFGVFLFQKRTSVKLCRSKS